MKIKIGNKIVGEEEPCFIIAEVGVNHNGSLELAKKFVDIAHESGADAVKFQTFKTENLVTRKADRATYQEKNIGGEETQAEMLKKLELSYDDFSTLKEYCDKKGIIFFSTPHSPDTVDFLDSIMPLYKIGSGDLTNIPFIKDVARKGKPIILATGMSTMKEMKEALNAIYAEGNRDVIMLHCTSNYPCGRDEVNLRAMQTMQEELDCLVGYSDHTLGIDVSLMAAKLGAVVVEKHYTLDKNLPGPDHKASIDSEELNNLIKTIRSGEYKNIDLDETVMGSPEKKQTRSEFEIAKVARKSIIANKDIPAGVTITSDMLIIKRPGTGIEPKNIDTIIGKTANKDIRQDELIQLQDIKKLPDIRKRRLVYISGTRADYGLMKSVLSSIKTHPELELEIIATGMHLMEEFGSTVTEIEEDGFKVNKIDVTFVNDNKESMALFLGQFVQKLTQQITKIRPDMILVLGDRAEMLGGALVGAYLSLPTVQLHGGEVTSTVDEFARHAITKLAHLHLPATIKSAERIRKLGEDQWRINIVGAPGLDHIINGSLLPRTELFEKLNLNDEKTFLVIQHPVTAETADAGKQIAETLEAVKELGYQTVIIYPNADAGGRKIIEVIKNYQKEPKFRTFKNLNHGDYLSLLNQVEVMIGNSSGGIIEAASFKLPVVNVGTRQEGRERTFNVIDVDYNKKAIKEAVRKALSLEFKGPLQDCINPYGDGKTGPRVAKFLSEIKIDQRVLQKKISY